jgi:leucine dehydrogenase
MSTVVHGTQSANGRRKTMAPAGIPPVALEHEELLVRRGRRSGLYQCVAVHSTALGPALGGLRLWHYDDPADAMRDALRLARGMTYKAASAGLDLGGGKGVICAPQAPPDAPGRRDLLLDFGDLVESLDGRYVTAEDVGITPADLEVIAERTTHLTGLDAAHGGSGDPSPFTALGVEAAMRACANARFGSSDLGGLTIAIAGLGHVGAVLARRLADDHAALIVSDIDSSRQGVAAELGARWLDPGEILEAECDILAPCALGGAIDERVLPRLRCEIVCGCANNQLSDEALAQALAEQGILYAPDFIVNAGGLIHVYKELRGYSEERATELALGIEDTLGSVFTQARDAGVTPLEAARRHAVARVASAGDPSVGLDRSRS